MIRRQNQYRKEIRDAMKGGDMSVEIAHLWEAEELGRNSRLFATLTLKVGASIGYHVHEHEAEYFTVLSGRAEVDDNGKTAILEPGDTIRTGAGEGHSVRSVGEETLVLLAVIVAD
ncbi:MAG: cupin domain-containing protein [Victivallaceae bacterium]|nr:cupin domain-containing protein [Victivallaceae bacterium]